MAKREGEQLMTGAAYKWGQAFLKGTGSTGMSHPFRRKSQRMIERFEKQHQERVEITLDQLESMGIEVGLERLEGELTLGVLDDFVEAHGLEHRGIDVVLSRFERVRYDHDEYATDEGGE